MNESYRELLRGFLVDKILCVDSNFEKLYFNFCFVFGRQLGMYFQYVYWNMNKFLKPSNDFIKPIKKLFLI